MTNTLRAFLLAASLATCIGSASAQGLPVVQAADALAQRLKTAIGSESRLRIAVLPLTMLSGSVDGLGRYLAESLTTAVFEAGAVEIVERTRMDAALTELRLGESGAIDPKTAQRIGNMLGADAVITGTVSEVGDGAEANVRMIHVGSGRVLAAGKVLIADPGSVPTDNPSGGVQNRTPRPSRTYGNFRVDVMEATAVRATGIIHVDMRYQNLTGQPIILSNPGSGPCGDAYGRNERGQMYHCIRGMGQVGNNQGITIPAGGITTVVYVWIPTQMERSRSSRSLSIKIPQAVASLVPMENRGEMGSYPTTVPRLIGRQEIVLNGLQLTLR